MNAVETAAEVIHISKSNCSDEDQSRIAHCTACKRRICRSCSMIHWWRYSEYSDEFYIIPFKCVQCFIILEYIAVSNISKMLFRSIFGQSDTSPILEDAVHRIISVYSIFAECDHKGNTAPECTGYLSLNVGFGDQIIAKASKLCSRFIRYRQMAHNSYRGFCCAKCYLYEQSL